MPVAECRAETGELGEAGSRECAGIRDQVPRRKHDQHSGGSHQQSGQLYARHPLSRQCHRRDEHRHQWRGGVVDARESGRQILPRPGIKHEGSDAKRHRDDRQMHQQPGFPRPLATRHQHDRDEHH